MPSSRLEIAALAFAALALASPAWAADDAPAPGTYAPGTYAPTDTSGTPGPSAPAPAPQTDRTRPRDSATDARTQNGGEVQQRVDREIPVRRRATVDPDAPPPV